MALYPAKQGSLETPSHDLDIRRVNIEKCRSKQALRYTGWIDRVRIPELSGCFNPELSLAASLVRHGGKPQAEGLMRSSSAPHLERRHTIVEDDPNSLSRI